jgi:LacI family transcriptional regulator
VSRAFSHPQVLRPDTVERVLQAARVAGYVPNRHARALSTGRTAAVAIIVPDIANPLFPPLIRHVENLAQDQGLTVVLADTNERADREEGAVTVLSHQVEGVILCSSRLPSTTLHRLTQQHRLVLVNRDVPQTSRVLFDTAPAVREAVLTLARLGHRHLAYLAGPQPRSWSNSQRRRAAETAAAETGVRLTTYPTVRGTYDDGRVLAARVIDDQVTAVIAFDDVIAHGLMGGLAELDILVPGDVSVIGCDDVLSTTTHPPLSTIAVDLHAAARAAMDMLLTGPAGTFRSGRTLLEARLVLRGTVGEVTAGPGAR